MNLRKDHCHAPAPSQGGAGASPKGPRAWLGRVWWVGWVRVGGSFPPLSPPPPPIRPPTPWRQPETKTHCEPTVLCGRVARAAHVDALRFVSRRSGGRLALPVVSPPAGRPSGRPGRARPQDSKIKKPKQLIFELNSRGDETSPSPTPP